MIIIMWSEAATLKSGKHCDFFLWGIGWSPDMQQLFFPRILKDKDEF